MKIYVQVLSLSVVAFAVTICLEGKNNSNTGIFYFSELSSSLDLSWQFLIVLGAPDVFKYCFYILSIFFLIPNGSTVGLGSVSFAEQLSSFIQPVFIEWHIGARG